MATVEKLKAAEKLLSRLSERKRSIIEHVKQQTESYSQHLASKLLIQGISPPSWLRDPSTSASKELNEEDLISRLLSQYQEGSARCSIASSPGHSNLIATGDREKFRDGDVVEIPATNEDLDQENEPVAPGFSCDDNGECALSSVPKLDHSAALPKDQTDENISNNYTIPDQSLAGIQRSKSRQKALKLRSSAKASGKSGLRHESNGDVVSSQIRFSLSITKQPCQNDDMSQWEEPCIIDNHSSVNRNVVETHSLNREEEVAAHSESRSESHAEVPISVGGSSPLDCSSNYYKDKACQDASVKRNESNPMSDTEHPDNHVNLAKSAGPSAVCRESIRGRADEDADFLCEDEEKNIHTGEIIRSDVSSRRQTCGCGSTKSGSSFDDYQGMDITMKDAGDYLPPDCFDGSLMKIHSCNVHNEGCDAQEPVLEDVQRYNAFPSPSSNQCNALPVEISDLELPSAYAKVYGGILTPSGAGSARQVNDSQEQLGLDKPSDEFRSMTRSKTHSYGKQTYRHVMYNGGNESIADCEGKSAEELQNSSVQSIPSYLSTHKMLHDDENGKLVMAGELCFPDHVDKSSLSSANYSKQGRGLESEVALTPSDSFASAEPKQLESKQTEEYDLKAFTSRSGKKLSCPFNDPDVPLDKGISGENYSLSSAGSARQVNSSQELPGLVKTSDGFRRVTRSQTHSYGKQRYLPVMYNKGTESISDREGKSAEELQISSVQSIPPYIGTHKLLHDDENGKLVMASELCLPDHVDKSSLSSSNALKQERGLEKAALTPSDSFASAEPKQLESKQTEEYDLEAFTSRSGKKLSCSLHDPDVPLDKGILGETNLPSSAGSARQVNDSQELPGLVKTSDGFRRVTRSQTHSYSKQMHLPVTYNEGIESISDREGKSAEELQISSVQSTPPYLGTHKLLHDDENGKLVMASELCLPDHVNKPRLSSSDYSKQGRGLESELALTPSDSFAFVEPKQLEVKQTEEYDLKAFTSRSGKKLSCSLHDPDVSLDKGIRGGNNQPSSSKQLPRMLDISTQGGKFCRDSFQPDVQDSPDTHNGKFGPVIDSVILNASKVSSEAELNFSSEVHGEMHDLPSKMVDITDIQILPVNLHVKYGPESSPVHSMEQGNFNDEASDKSQLVLSVPESKNSRLSHVQESEKDPAANSSACLIKKAGTNPIAVDEIKQYPAHQTCPESGVSSKHGDSSLGITSLGRPSMIRLDDKNSSFERRLRHVRTESWPQIKRRKIEHQQDRGFATSKSFRVKKPHTFQWDPDIAYQKTMEIEIDSGLVVHVEKSKDDGLCLEVNANPMEEIQPVMLSQQEEVESCYVEKSENEHTSPVINNEQLAATISSLAKKECRNSQGCFVEGTRTSPLTCDYLDASLSGYKQCRQNLCNLENNTDNQSSDIMKLSSTLTEEIQQPPKWEDGLHMQHSVLSSSHEDLQLIDFDQSMPVFEGFIVNAETDTEEMNLPAVGFDLGELELPRTTLERASILAEICRSASSGGPSSHFSSAFKFQDTANLCNSVSDDGHLEHTQFGDANPLNAEVGIHFQSCSSSSDDYKDALDGMPYSVSFAYSGERYGWDSRNQPPSPVGKLWNQFSSHSGSSGKCSTSNPELTCFPIEEDPSSSEENKTMEENAGDTQDETDSPLANNCGKRNPLTDLTNMCTNPPMSVSTEEETLRADSVDFLRSKFSVTGTQEKTLLGQKYQFRKNSEASEKQTSCTHAADGRKHQLSSICSNATNRAKESVYNSISKSTVSTKTRLKGRDQKLSSRGSRSNNIVSNISSFIPLIQQKQAATAGQGKRDVKVKALEAAEAAKRVEEQKENERKKRKEALKLERAKLEEKNLKHIELEKKKKEEDRKKKDAEVIAKKRLREEEEKKEKEKKRMRLESRQRQREQEEKKRVARPEKENQRTKDDQMKRKKEFNNESKKQQNREITGGESVAMQEADNNLTLNEFVANYEESGTSAICDGEGMHAVNKSPRNEDLIVQNNNGKSYEISPYQCTDDEDEEDDELRSKKRIPSWSSKSSIALFLPMQHQLDPDVIFPLESFCSIGEILLPRKLQQKKVAA
ncbi:uncharacterized protein LOC121756336 [Salvia splendens]|uniref:uncharacterized protein LOC121756336 n=1 Tax=Salvia splendens TaxID=180675 RepID=UPI001C261DA4|nr:uncharacterized protein LOC121756336 [Salvia splendens]XP_042007787.1 uncharacterized protein LOC121756336 [Salvia splendens]XP_042007788.1 uncharacterized protein LOC121756336 [Salvia splendens]